MEGDIPIKLLEDELNKIETSGNKFVSYFLLFMDPYIICLDRPTCTRTYTAFSHQTASFIRILKWGSVQ